MLSTRARFILTYLILFAILVEKNCAYVFSFLFFRRFFDIGTTFEKDAHLSTAMIHNGFVFAEPTRTDSGLHFSWMEFSKNCHFHGFSCRYNLKSGKFWILSWHFCNSSTSRLTASVPCNLHEWSLITSYYFRRIMRSCEKILRDAFAYELFFWDYFLFT